MTPEQVELLKASWAKVMPIREQAAELFYGRLFEIAPEVKPLFKGDMKEQGRKLMQSISTVVASSDKLESVIPVLEDMGRRHVHYGVRDEHYDVVGAALLWTLEQGLGADFTPETSAAWLEAYTAIAGVMKGAAVAA